MDVRDITEKIKQRSSSEIAAIEKAFRFAEKYHEGELRYSGEPYLVHPFAVAQTLAGMHLDTNTIIAGLLHDVCESAPEEEKEARKKEIEKQFGKDVAFLVEGVTKLGKLRAHGEERYLENMRKMFLSIAQDVRVVLIRLADRLHNMQTLSAVPQHKQKRIADETLEIYAPLAGRLGMGKLRGSLEDLAFPFSYPKEYNALIDQIEERRKRKEVYLAKVKYKLNEELKSKPKAKVAK